MPSKVRLDYNQTFYACSHGLSRFAVGCLDRMFRRPGEEVCAVVYRMIPIHSQVRPPTNQTFYARSHALSRFAGGHLGRKLRDCSPSYLNWILRLEHFRDDSDVFMSLHSQKKGMKSTN